MDSMLDARNVHKLYSLELVGFLLNDYVTNNLCIDIVWSVSEVFSCELDMKSNSDTKEE